MRMRVQHRRARAAGFTLIELVITMVIVAILAAIAVPLYQRDVRESRRTDARTALLDLAAREQRYFSVQNAFTENFADLGYAAAGTDPTSITVGSGYYTVTVSVPTTNPDTFLLTAVPVGGTTQASDTECQKFTVDNTGQQLAYDSSGSPQPDCWQ